MKIYVDVYLAKNLGDDLFLDILSYNFPNIDFYINYYGKEYDDFFKMYKNLYKSKYPLCFKILNKLKIYDYINDIKRIAKKYDAYLFLGGSIFREESYWKDVYKYRIKIAETFKESFKPVFVIGANFGPYKTMEFYNSYYKFFSLCNEVCFRDNYSKELFKSLNHIKVEKDIVFQLETSVGSSQKGIISYSIIEPEHKDNLNEYRNDYIMEISDSIIYNFKKKRKSYLLSFCEKEGDLNICKEIYNSLPYEIKKTVIILNYNNNISDFIKIISNSELLVASRFHANIIGLITNIKILPFVYSEKTTQVLNDINYKGKILYINNCKGKLINDIESVINSDSIPYKITEKDILSSIRQFDSIRRFIT